VQLAIVIGGALREHAHPDRRYAIAGGQRVDDPLTAALHGEPRIAFERRCLPKTFKRMFVGSPKGIFKMLEKIKKA
jgi:hypothetical protein